MLLEAKQLKVVLSGRHILKGVDLELAEGEIYGLLGPNGAGKTTTILAALDLVPLVSGTVRISGKDPARDRSVFEIIGVLPEQNGFDEWMTPVQYLRFFARLYERPDSPAAIHELLRKVGLAEDAGRLISTFSRGMKQRLGIARALVPNPRLLILDEPTNGLDPRGRREIHNLLLDLSQQHGVGVLLCTHLLDDVDRLCQRIGVISGGQSVAQGEISDLIKRSGQHDRYQLVLASSPPEDEAVPNGLHVVSRGYDRVLVAPDPGTEPSKLWQQLFSLGWSVNEIRRQGSGLEDLYLSLTETES